MPKVVTHSHSAAGVRRHNPLVNDILSAGHLRTKSSKHSCPGDIEDNDPYVDAKASRKILQIGRHLAEEEATEQQVVTQKNSEQKNPAFDFLSRLDNDDQMSDSDEEEFADDQWGDEEVEEAEIDPNDLDLFRKFIPDGGQDLVFNSQQLNPSDAGQGTNLADLILEKIAVYEAKKAGQSQPMIYGGGAPEEAVQIPAKALDVFEKVGMILSRYKSGPLPKPFKVLPTLPQWSTLLDITRPDSWTPNAVYAATRTFISSKPVIAQDFISIVLLERVREEIHETRKLNVHVYNALKKALFKPACFFKGLLFPLVASGTCTLREAHIISSVITRISIPVLHSAVALLRLCEIAAEQTSTSLFREGTGATNIFIRAFLEKKYALPYKVIDALVFHFLRFRAGGNSDDTIMADSNIRQPASASAAKDSKLPVLWHQSLLVFAQRYRNDITEDQREALLDLLLVCGHKDIGPEVRRELLAGRGRGVIIADNEPKNGADGDDTMDFEM